MKKKLLYIGGVTLTIAAVIAQAVVTSEGLQTTQWATMVVTALESTTFNTDQLTVGGGGDVTKILTATGNVDFAACGTNATVTANITVTGATTNGACFFNLVTPHTSFRYNAFVSAADTVTISASNISITNAINQDPISARVVVFQF
jgi:hypothetical protein